MRHPVAEAIARRYGGNQAPSEPISPEDMKLKRLPAGFVIPPKWLWLQTTSARRWAPMDRRCRFLCVFWFETCFPRRFACPALKCTRECADLLITEKPSNLRYR